MAKPTAFGVSIDTSEIEGFAERLAGLSGEALGRAMVEAINETTERTYALGRKTMLSGINLQDAYIQRRMEVEPATMAMPRATITAFGGKEFVTGLSHYGAIQERKDVNWSNARITSMGKEFGDWPGWTRRTGNTKLGIAADQKADGKSVEVVRGKRKRMGPVFSIPKYTDKDGNFLLFSREKSGKIKSKTGPSVYQLFRAAIPKIKDQTQDDLQKSVIEEAERAMKNILP